MFRDLLGVNVAWKQMPADAQPPVATVRGLPVGKHGAPPVTSLPISKLCLSSTFPLVSDSVTSNPVYNCLPRSKKLSLFPRSNSHQPWGWKPCNCHNQRLFQVPHTRGPLGLLLPGGRRRGRAGLARPHPRHFTITGAL